MKSNLSLRTITALVLLGLAASHSAYAGKRTTTTPSWKLYQAMDTHDTAKWYLAGDWNLPSPFISGICQSQSALNNSILTIKLETKICANRSYAGGQYQTTGFYQYGYYEARIKAAKGGGVVTGFFTYTGPSDGKPHDEIDIEFLGNDTTKMQTNYYVGGVGGHEKMIDLGFDAAAGYHTYAFDWQADSIKWYVDGKLVRTVTTTTDGPLPTNPGKIMANVWACDAVSWCGSYTPSSTPYSASFDWIGYR